MGAFSIVFTPANVIPINGVITISVPSGYFAARASAAALGVTLVCASPCTSANAEQAVQVTDTEITVVVTGGPTTASAITLTFPGGLLTTGKPRAGSADGVRVSTTRDFASPGAASAALGGQVAIGTTLTLAAGDRVGKKVTASAFSIVFTPVNAIPSGGIITITTPLNYFANRGAGAALAA